MAFNYTQSQSNILPYFLSKPIIPQYPAFYSTLLHCHTTTRKGYSSSQWLWSYYFLELNHQLPLRGNEQYKQRHLFNSCTDFVPIHRSSDHWVNKLVQLDHYLLHINSHLLQPLHKACSTISTSGQSWYSKIAVKNTPSVYLLECTNQFRWDYLTWNRSRSEYKLRSHIVTHKYACLYPYRKPSGGKLRHDTSTQIIHLWN